MRVRTARARGLDLEGVNHLGKTPPGEGRKRQTERSGGNWEKEQTEGREGKDETEAPHPCPHPSSPFSQPGQGQGQQKDVSDHRPCLGAKKIFPERH